mgnify:FL=1|tara:strand:+ start:253 stop:438 length:186 start_codon:yes stop_codon:yes gene_type:complete
MKVGSLVHSRHDPAYRGIVMEIGPEQTRTDHGRRACRVRWFDGDETFEFIKVLEVVSEPTS